MPTRTSSMALDGHSVEADLLADDETKGKVEVAILGILRQFGPATDDEIVSLYECRRIEYPEIPKVTPQRVRTARSALARRGLVIGRHSPGRSALGNPATLWSLNLKDAV